MPSTLTKHQTYIKILSKLFKHLDLTGVQNLLIIQKK